MREGGQRIVIIPSDKAYGAFPPAGSGIAPDEALVYLVEVVNVTEAQGSGG